MLLSYSGMRAVSKGIEFIRKRFQRKETHFKSNDSNFPFEMFKLTHFYLVCIKTLFSQLNYIVAVLAETIIQVAALQWTASMTG